MQHLAHLRLTVRASNPIDTPQVNTAYCKNRNIDLPFNDSTDLSFQQRLSSCIVPLDRPQLPATIVQLYFHDSTYASYPHRMSSCAQLRLDHTSYRHHPSRWRPRTTATDFTYTFVIPAINRHFCCIYYLVFVPFIVFGCQYSHALNLNSFAWSTCLSAPQHSLQRFNNNESGEVCCLLLRVWSWEVSFSFFFFCLTTPYMLYIFCWPHAPHHPTESNMCWEWTKGVTNSPKKGDTWPVYSSWG